MWLGHAIVQMNMTKHASTVGTGEKVIAGVSFSEKLKGDFRISDFLGILWLNVMENKFIFK